MMATIFDFYMPYASISATFLANVQKSQKLAWFLKNHSMILKTEINSENI